MPVQGLNQPPTHSLFPQIHPPPRFFSITCDPSGVTDTAGTEQDGSDPWGRVQQEEPHLGGQAGGRGQASSAEESAGNLSGWRAAEPHGPHILAQARDFVAAGTSCWASRALGLARTSMLREGPPHWLTQPQRGLSRGLAPRVPPVLTWHRRAQGTGQCDQGTGQAQGAGTCWAAGRPVFLLLTVRWDGGRGCAQTPEVLGVLGSAGTYSWCPVAVAMGKSTY